MRDWGHRVFWSTAGLSFCLVVSGCGATTRDPEQHASAGGVAGASTGGVIGSGGTGVIGSGGTGVIGSGGTGVIGSGGTTVADFEPNFRHGTRLYAQTVSFPGTAPLFVGIYDQLLRTPCEFRATPDGKLRCLPADSIGAANPADVEPLEQWQEGVGMRAQSAIGRLVRNEIHSTDGGQFPNRIQGEYYDPEFAQPCSADTSQRKDGTGEGLCLPRYAAWTGIFFADSDCSIPLANADLGVSPLIISSPEREVFALGAAYEGQAFVGYAKGAACEKFPEGSAQFFRLGEPLFLGALAPIQQVPRGDARLALQMIESQGRTVAPVRHRALSNPANSLGGPYFDRDLGVLCQPAWTLQGEVRCVPSEAWFTSELSLTNFGDPDCKHPVINIDTPFAVITRSEAPRTRAAVVSVHRVGATATATGYWFQNGVCRESLRASGYPLLEEVPLEGFAELTADMGQ